ncbi:MAG: purine-nucleoside phosphorylase, partial [Actinomycetota bacterium]|nr:purine-nucleoside phosphorylase [Actinomycetota bacterium]
MSLHSITGRSDFRVAVVLGSGLAPVARSLTGAEPIPYSSIEGWPHTRVPGHEGALYAGEVEGTPALVLAGRVHLYEGHPSSAVTHIVDEVVASGCRTIVLTNAAGGIDESFGVGDPVLISDHLNLTGSSPLLGAPTFVDLSEVYDPELRALARRVDPTLKEGVYAGVVGPAYETPAEIRMLATMGADLVGMSTVHEAIAAHALGARVLGISVVTNRAAGLGAKLDHEEVQRAGARAAGRMETLLRGVLAEL